MNRIIVISCFLAACANGSSEDQQHNGTPAGTSATTTLPGGSTTSTSWGGTGTGGSGTGTATGSTTTGGATGGLGQPGQLTAGAWRDLDDWSFWTDLTDDPQGGLYQMDEAWGFYFDERYPVLVEDDRAEPVVDARAVLYDGQDVALWEGRTDNLGRAELFAGLYGDQVQGPLRIEVDTDGIVMELDNPIAGDIPNVFEMIAPPPLPNLDVVFIVDTTGSMSDELDYLNAELIDVMDRVTLAGNVDLRVGAVYYRDTSDAYLVEMVGLNSDVTAVADDMAGRTTNGGGDIPEALEVGLDVAVRNLQWSDSARSRIAFLVADAAAHDEDAPALRATVQEAAAKGIRVIPVASSGVTLHTTAMMRSIDIATGATYTFLTDDSGIGGTHIDPIVGQFQVEFLNDLLVRLILESIE